MDIEYFFYVDDSTLQHLRPATSDERKWYHSLAQELSLIHIFRGIRSTSVKPALAFFDFFRTTRCV